MPVQYAEPGYKLETKAVSTGGFLQLRPGQAPGGYGSRITTDRVLVYPGSNRKYRVYATCYSNVASHWITKGGARLYLRDCDIVD